MDPWLCFTARGVGGRRIAAAIQSQAAIDDDDDIQTERLANLQKLLSQKDQGRNFIITDESVDEALCHLAKIGHSTWHVEVCRLLICERILNNSSSHLVEKYSMEKNVGGSGPLHFAAGHHRVNIARLLVEEFSSIFNVNQMDVYSLTPLRYAVMHGGCLETCRVLLENGSNPNIFYKGESTELDSPLFRAIKAGNTEMVGLLLEYGADPRVTNNVCHDSDFMNADTAIKYGRVEILTMLLDHGARIGTPNRSAGLSLLLRDEEASRETKLDICRILAKHAKKNEETADYLLNTFKNVFFIHKNHDNDNHHHHLEASEILLLVGITPCRRVLSNTVEQGNVNVWQLFVQFGIDPFYHYEEEEEEENHGYYGSSPFHTAAHQQDTTLFEFFVDLWKQRFASSSGRDANGDAPIDILCRDPRVSIQAVTLLVEKFDVNLSTAVHGYFPFQSAIKVNAGNLDVIYYLLKQWPDVLAEPFCIDRAPAASDNDESLAAADNESLLQMDNESHQPTIESILAENASLQVNNESSLRAEIELLQQRLAAMQVENDTMRATSLVAEVQQQE